MTDSKEALHWEWNPDPHYWLDRVWSKEALQRLAETRPQLLHNLTHDDKRISACRLLIKCESTLVNRGQKRSTLAVCMSGVSICKDNKSWATSAAERERAMGGERRTKKELPLHCTFHGGWRRAWGGECVNIGEGPFARLIKGLDAERVRGRLIKPLDFVCVVWSFIHGYESAMTGTRRKRKDLMRKRVKMTKSKQDEWDIL